MLKQRKKELEELKAKQQESQAKVIKNNNLMKINEVQNRLNFVFEKFTDMSSEAIEYKLHQEPEENDVFVEQPLGIFEISKNYFNAIEIFNNELKTFLTKNSLNVKENYTKVNMKTLPQLDRDKSEAYVEIDSKLQTVFELDKSVKEIEIKKHKDSTPPHTVSKSKENQNKDIAKIADSISTKPTLTVDLSETTDNDNKLIQNIKHDASKDAIDMKKIQIELI